MGYCVCCGELATGEHDFKTYSFCSIKCMDKYLLNMCKDGRISFLDLPKETRDRENNNPRCVYKCHSVTCPVCGTVFYASSYFGEHYRKYCSDSCIRVAMKPVWKKNGLLNSGWLSQRWKGGISQEGYCQKFNADLRRRVRVFFGNKCFLCGKTQEENTKRLAVHHVNYNKNACCDSSKVMLVPLCLECHGRTNSDREHWEDYFETILREKYNYKCYYTKEEYNNLKSEECSS